MTYYTTKENEKKLAEEANARKAAIANQEKIEAARLANEHKATAEKTVSDEPEIVNPDLAAFNEEHMRLVDERKAAEKTVWDHRQSPTVEKLKALEEAEAK